MSGIVERYKSNVREIQRVIEEIRDKTPNPFVETALSALDISVRKAVEKLDEVENIRDVHSSFGQWEVIRVTLEPLMKYDEIRRVMDAVMKLYREVFVYIIGGDLSEEHPLTKTRKELNLSAEEVNAVTMLIYTSKGGKHEKANLYRSNF